MNAVFLPVTRELALRDEFAPDCSLRHTVRPARVSRIGSRDRDRIRQHDAVARDEPAFEQHQLARRMRGDRLRDAASSDREEVSRTTDRDAVRGDAERAGAGGADQIERGLHLIVTTEIALPSNDRRALQKIAGAVGRPGIADIVVAGENQNTGGAQHLDGRQSDGHRRRG